MIGSYPKIYNLGHAAIKELFLDPVLCEEKIDGSQISFGVLAGELHARSKSKPLDLDVPDKMFAAGVETAKNLAPILHPDWVYRGEYLAKPKHNTLAYDRVPAGNIVVYDIQNGPESYLTPSEKSAECARIGLEHVPVFAYARVETMEGFLNLMENTSMLGGQKIEGIVFKNYNRFGVDGHALMGKHVSEVFKEVHRGEWKAKNPGQTDLLGGITLSYRTPARWQKAIQHLQEKGELENSPRDIGKLVREIQEDIVVECSDEIKEKLLTWALPQLRRSVVAGFPEWYKSLLASSQFEGTE